MIDPSDLIHSYSRAQALADGVLIDVSDTAREAGLSPSLDRNQTRFNRWRRQKRSPAAIQRSLIVVGDDSPAAFTSRRR
jgi:hypothetical protein